jgi:peptidoglycan/LPS O-acetylase OafA/YrhL
MGAFRLVLAVMVVTYHAGWSPFGYSPGIVAVVCFFLISGFVTTKLIDHHYPSARYIGAFYLERAARIFPQYLFFVAVTIIAAYALKIDNTFLSAERCTGFKLALNLMAIPLDYYAFNSVGDCMLIPQAWSLGLEMTFYIVAPLVVLLPVVGQAGLFASAIVFFCAYRGMIDSDLYGYRLLPGTFFIFYAGALMAKAGRVAAITPWVVWAAALSMMAFSLYEGVHRFAIKEVLLGVALGIPAVFFLKDLKFTRLDARLGDLSYGVFLSHIICIWAAQSFGLEKTTPLYWIAIFVSSFALAFAAYISAERKSAGLRRKIRARGGRETELVPSDLSRQRRNPFQATTTGPVTPMRKGSDGPGGSPVGDSVGSA